MDDVAAALRGLPALPTARVVAAILPEAWRELLVDIGEGRVADGEDGTALLYVPDVDEYVPVEHMVDPMRHAWLVRQPGDGRRWALGPLGEKVVALHVGEAGAT